MDTDQTCTEQTYGRTDQNGKKYVQHHMYRKTNIMPVRGQKSHNRPKWNGPGQGTSTTTCMAPQRRSTTKDLACHHLESMHYKKRQQGRPANRWRDAWTNTGGTRSGLAGTFMKCAVMLWSGRVWDLIVPAACIHDCEQDSISDGISSRAYRTKNLDMPGPSYPLPQSCVIVYKEFLFHCVRLRRGVAYSWHLHIGLFPLTSPTSPGGCTHCISQQGAVIKQIMPRIITGSVD